MAVDVVPERQTASDLLAALPRPAGVGRVLLAQADRADSVLADGLSANGWRVEPVVAYSTSLRTPSPAERAAALGCDIVAFASGSAAVAWSDAIGVATPPIAVAIGPTTCAVALQQGLQITHVATDHSVEGLAHAVAAAWCERS